MQIRQTQQQQEYVGRINRAMDYIQAHLSEELSLEAVSRAAGFSRFHFHRIFSSFCGETLNHFVKRIRVERAAFHLTGNPTKSVTEIALDCGFSSSAAFARAFKEILGMSASEWRNGGGAKSNILQTESNICKANGNAGKAFELSMGEDGWQSTTPTWRIQMNANSKNRLDAHIEVKEMPQMSVVYVRHVGAYKGDDALFGRLIGKLCDWAGPRGLIGANSPILMVYHDDPNITDDDKLRLDVCLRIDKEVDVSGDIGKTVIPGGKCAVGHFEISSDQFSDAWNAMMAGFLPQSGFQPDDRPPYELYAQDPGSHPENKYVVDICLPVKPL
ncbi:MAG: AraC family transcriptional regulator [Deltaproteobacteria bacterium]|nr:AraC family transcriptional regulator [Deltaproteobacteria bacterium]